MAKGVQLATAYISLNVNTNKIKGQVDSALRGAGGQGRQVGASIGANLIAGIRENMTGGKVSSFFAPIGIAGIRWAGVAGRTIGTALKTAIVASVSAGIGAAIFGAGAAIVAGLDRLKILQQSTVQLRLRLSDAEIKKVQKDITDVVKGTPIALDKAMQAVPRAINAGLRGEELKQYIKDIADLTASTGGQGQFDQLAVILEQIRSKGKLAGDEIQQLVDAGVDVRGILKETFGWDDKTLENNLKKNKVGIKELQKAIQGSFGKNGGLSKQMGDTLDGAMGNLRASVARLGANFIAAITGKKADEDPLKDFAAGITSATEGLDKMGAWVNDNRDEIHGFFKTAGNIIGWVGDKVGKLPGLFNSAKTAASGAADWVSRAWTNVTTTIGKVKDKVGEVVDSIKTKFTNIMGEVEKKFNSIFGENGWFAQQFKKLADLVDKVRDVLGLGPATANAAAPGGTTGSTTPFNAGPMSPSVAAGQAPLSGSGMGLSSVPQMGYDPNGNPLVPLGANGSAKPSINAQMPTRSGVGSPLYSGAPTEDTGGAVEPRNAFLGTIIPQMFPGATLGNDYREKDGYNEHSSGQAGDIMISTLGKRTEEGIALGNKINQWLIANAEKVGLRYTIWNGMLYRPDGSTTPNKGQGITGNHEDHVHYRVKPGKMEEVPQFATGGKILGAGTGTSDSIPAMLSNGEHVLTAEDVKRMGGQNGVYAFRAALKNGMIPGFAPGGAVDPDQVKDMTNQVNDLNTSRITAQKQLQELPEDATSTQRLQAEISASQAQRAWEQASADLPIVSAGGTPPDRSIQNNVLDTTDTARLSLAQLNDLRARAAEGDDIAPSQLFAAEASANQAVRNRLAAIEAMKQQNQPVNFLDEFQRSAGFVPTAAGNTGVAGTSSLSSIIGMGNEVVGGLIDTGASLAQTAVSAGVTAGTLGAGAAAGPAAGAAASYGIQMGASIAKRVSSYGFQMASIGADSLIAQLMPFGAPRWLGYDYTGFMPSMGIQNAALTTIEKMGNQAIQQRMNPQGGVIPPLNPNPGSPEAAVAAPPDEAAPPMPFDPNQGLLQQGDPGFYNPDPFNPFQPVPGGGGGSWAKGGAIKVYDEGGVLRPGDLALNASTRPEKILTQTQWDALGKLTPKGSDGPMVQIGSITGLSPEDVANKIEAKQKLAMMRYAGRP